MSLTAENFYEKLNTFRVLPEKIDSIDLNTFMRVFGDAEAGIEKNIVYVFRTEKPIPRVKGESDIVYIGETKGTFRKRYLVNAKRFTSKLNSMKYQHILETYGPIRITIADCYQFGDSSEQAEEQLLWAYFQNHCEHPPVNYTKPKIPKKVVSLG